MGRKGGAASKCSSVPSASDASVSGSPLRKHIEPVSVEDPLSLAAKLAEALSKAKVDELNKQGFKALPLSVSGCSARVYGASQTIFQLVELQTSYDFSKLSSLDVDILNTQKLIDKSSSSRDLLHAVPIVLQPTNKHMRLVFIYVFRKCSQLAQRRLTDNDLEDDLANWSLKNSRGEEVTFLSPCCVESSSTCPERSMLVCGSPDVALDRAKSHVDDAVGRKPCERHSDSTVEVGSVERKSAAVQGSLPRRRNKAKKRKQAVGQPDKGLSQPDPSEEDVSLPVAVQMPLNGEPDAEEEEKPKEQQEHQHQQNQHEQDLRQQGIQHEQVAACDSSSSDENSTSCRQNDSMFALPHFSHAEEETALMSDSTTEAWQTVCSRRRRRGEHGQGAHSTSALAQSGDAGTLEDKKQTSVFTEHADEEIARGCMPLSASSAISDYTPEDDIVNSVSQHLQPKMSDDKQPEFPQVPEIEKLLAGWMATVRVADACGRWEGPRIWNYKGSGYWHYKRNENACWRRWFLKNKEWSNKPPSQQCHSYSGQQKQVCDACAWGQGGGKLCTCQPDPWQPLPAVEPDGSNPLPSSKIDGPTPLADLSVIPPSLDEENAWRHLLRGTHAFSLQGSPTPVSLYPDAPDEAVAARRRQRNAGWRRWWLAKLDASSIGCPHMSFPSTPTSSLPGTPREHLPWHHDASSNAPVAVPADPIVLLPIPLHLAAPVHQYAQQLQAAANGKHATFFRVPGHLTGERQ